jgi:hypothetical protein
MTRTTHRTARALVCVAACMFFAVFSAQASTFKESNSAGRGLGFVYDPAKEVTLSGTVQKFVTQPAHGSPMGLHVFVSTDGKVVDAHIGPYLSKQIQQSLRLGQSVQIVGVQEHIQGKNFFLARQVEYAGHQLTVRNEHGLLIGQASHHKVHYGKAAHGGAR